MKSEHDILKLLAMENIAPSDYYELMDNIDSMSTEELWALSGQEDGARYLDGQSDFGCIIKIADNSIYTAALTNGETLDRIEEWTAVNEPTDQMLDYIKSHLDISLTREHCSRGPEL